MSPDLERLIGRAVIDKAFRKQLLDDPEAAIRNAGLNITPDELDKVKDAANKRKKKRDDVDRELDAARGSSWS